MIPLVSSHLLRFEAMRDVGGLLAWLVPPGSDQEDYYKQLILTSSVAVRAM
jgi:hypothetical protein